MPCVLCMICVPGGEKVGGVAGRTGFGWGVGWVGGIGVVGGVGG